MYTYFGNDPPAFFSGGYFAIRSASRYPPQCTTWLQPSMHLNSVTSSWCGRLVTSSIVNNSPGVPGSSVLSDSPASSCPRGRLFPCAFFNAANAASNAGDIFVSSFFSPFPPTIVLAAPPCIIGPSPAPASLFGSTFASSFGATFVSCSTGPGSFFVAYLYSQVVTSSTYCGNR